MAYCQRNDTVNTEQHTPNLGLRGQSLGDVSPDGTASWTHRNSTLVGQSVRWTVIFDSCMLIHVSVGRAVEAFGQRPDLANELEHS